MTRRERKFATGTPQVLDLFWDGDDRLRSVKNGVDVWFTGRYNGDGERVSKSDLWTGAHDYSWGPGGVLFDSRTILRVLEQRLHGAVGRGAG